MTALQISASVLYLVSALCFTYCSDRKPYPAVIYIPLAIIAATGYLTEGIHDHWLWLVVAYSVCELCLSARWYIKRRRSRRA